VKVRLCLHNAARPAAALRLHTIAFAANLIPCDHVVYSSLQFPLFYHPSRCLHFRQFPPQLRCLYTYVKWTVAQLEGSSTTAMDFEGVVRWILAILAVPARPIKFAVKMRVLRKARFRLLPQRRLKQLLLQCRLKAAVHCQRLCPPHHQTPDSPQSPRMFSLPHLRDRRYTLPSTMDQVQVLRRLKLRPRTVHHHMSKRTPRQQQRL
jgi:hypothetical protein